MNTTASFSRRDFGKGTGSAAAAALGTLEFAHQAHAEGSDEIKIALIGCGGRGTGAAVNALSNKSHSAIRLVAMADAFEAPLEASLKNLRRQFGDRVDVPDGRRFVGLDAYEKAIDSGADLVLLCTPPGFRPAHFAAAVKAGKHIFMEKPVAVDAPGYVAVKAANVVAKTKGLYVAVGHNMRHDPVRQDLVRQIHDGLIGKLQFTRSYFNTSGIWNRPRQTGMTEMQYQVSNWYHFVWLSGDHLVEQHVHGIDQCNWLAQQAHPVQATGMGGRQVRAEPGIGEIFDHHCVQFTYADGSYSFSECRQQPGCWSNVSNHAHGTKGSVHFDGREFTVLVTGADPKRFRPGPESHQTEWDDLIAAMVAGRPYNEADWGADSTMTAILGRMATYSGKLVTWDDAIRSELTYAPARLAWGATPHSKPGPDGIYPCALPGVTKAF